MKAERSRPAIDELDIEPFFNSEILMSACLSPVLEDIFATGLVQKPNGDMLKSVAGVSRENIEAIFRTIVEKKPAMVIEIGMAYGTSTLAILSALAHNGKGKLISIDPYIKWDTGMAVALHQVEKAGFSALHQHVRKCSQVALAEMWESGFKADFIYIDGYHNVEYVMADTFFSDKILNIGGTLVFNDCGWRAVHKTVRFLQRHRRYAEEPVLPKAYRGRNFLYSFAKFVQGRSSNDRYFRKLEDWEPDSGFYRDF
jgi:predicted O-methyltransferase YrrM